MEMFQKGASPFRCSNSIFKEEYMGEKRYIISDASKMLNVESHVLRYWEEELEIKIPRNEMDTTLKIISKALEKSGT